MMKKMKWTRSKQADEVDASLSSAVVTDEKKQEHEKRISELVSENEAFQKEIMELKGRLANVSSSSTNNAQKLSGDYLQKLNVLEEQVIELKKKLDTQSQLSIQRHKGDGATKQLHFEVQSLKAQKVQLQCKIKLESVQFRFCKASLEKEVLQLQKERRRNEYEMRKILASNQRLKMVVQRKTEEASMATKQLRSLLETRKTASQRRAGAKNGKNSGIQGIEHQIEATKQLHELCSNYEQQMEEIAEEAAKLWEEADALKEEKLRWQLQEKDSDLLKKDTDINELKEQMDTLSHLVRQLPIQKAELIRAHRVQDDAGPPSISSCTNNSFEDIETSESERNSGRSNVTAKKKSTSELCCSCSKKSLCKTTKCKCRSTGSSCGASCGCVSSKCSNRKSIPINSSSIADQEETNSVSSQASVVEKPFQTKKPLSEIGNRSIQMF